MKLLVHIGLHKTATTYLQHLLSLNSARLAKAGVHYKPDPPHAAHHTAAWRSLVGDVTPVATIVQNARLKRSRVALVSSEDFEGLLFHPQLAGAVEKVALAEGACQVEWHVCLRDPGQYFASIYAEMANHWFVDGLAMYQSALDWGYGRIDTREGISGAPPYWQFCFDHERHVEHFAAHLTGSVVLHDYRDASPYPAHRMLRALEVLDLLTDRPGAETRNGRRPSPWVESQYFRRAMNLLKGVELPENTVYRLNDRLRTMTDLIGPLSKEVSRRYAAGMERLLARGVIVTNRPSVVAALPENGTTQAERHWKEIIKLSAWQQSTPEERATAEATTRPPAHRRGS